MTVRVKDARLEPFTKEQPWEERVDLIKRQFPAVTDLNWKKAFDDDLGLFARLVRDILKLDQVEPGRSGPRPALEPLQGRKSLRQITNEDYATIVFHEALAALGHGLSLRGLEAKTHIAKSRLQRLMTGGTPPTIDDMEKVAAGFKKHASYFSEWRAAYVTVIVNDRLTWNPEASIRYYDEIVRRSKA